MRLYQNIDVTITCQSFGSSWICGLRGKVADIERVYNGLYYRATEGKLEYQFDTLDGRALALFWTSEEGMTEFFYQSMLNMRLNHFGEEPVKKKDSFEWHYAKEKIARLKKEKETFLTFDRGQVSNPYLYSSGTIAAERPDVDMKDAILNHAFAAPE